MIIHLLTEDRTGSGRTLNYPIWKNRQALEERGLSFRFFRDDPYAKALTQCDMLWINFNIFRTWWKKKKDAIFERFEFYQSQVGSVFYFDTQDSAGTIQHEILPYVKRYYKFFLLKDKSQYRNKLYGGRLFTDYYHEKFRISDAQETPPELVGIVDTKYHSKLRSAWNPGFTFKQNNKPNILNLFNYRFVSPTGKRPVPVTCRMNLNYGRETIRYQRERIAGVLKSMSVPLGKLSRRKYFKELSQSKIGISPFGWGEFAYRDFEIFIKGCLLFKPDMSHLETWPEFYIPNKTYVPFKWDFTDFKENIDQLLSQPRLIIEYAERGQNLYKWYTESREVKELYIDRVVEMATGN